MSKKPAGTRVTFREVVHPEPLCKPGDILETITGRRYEVLSVEGKRIECLILRIGAKVADDATILRWTWDPKRKTKVALRFTEGSTDR